MLNFLGITRHLSTTAGYAKRIGWLLHEDVTQSPFPVTGVSFTGTVKTEQGDLPIAITHGEQENYLELTFPALPIGRWPYAIHAQDESGEDLRLFAGYIGAVESVPPIEASTVYDIPVMGIAIPIEAGKTIKAQWLSNTAASLAAQQAQQDASSTRTDADTASQAATTATGAAITAAERAREAEGYAGAAQASKVAAGNAAASASTSAADAANDARSANDAKTAVEGIVSDFTQTISAAKKEAISSIQAKQADAVLAVGRAQKTATDNVAAAQSTAVAAVQTAQTTATGEITPLVERAEAAKEQAQAVVNGLAITPGTVTTGAPGSQAAAALTPGSAPGAYTLDMTIPRGDVGATGPRGGKGDRGAVGPQGPAGVVDTSQTYTWTQPQTYAAAINANGGVMVPMPSALMPNTVLNWSGLIGLSALDIAFRAKFVQPTGELKSGVGTITDTMGGKEFSVAKGNAGSFLARYNIVAATFPESAYGGVCGFCLPLMLNLEKGSKIKLSTPVRGAFTQTYNPDDFDVYSVNCPAFFDLTLERLADNTYAVRTRAYVLNRKTTTLELVTTTASLPIGKIKALWWVQPSAYSAECGIYVMQESCSIYKVSESNALETFEYSGITSLIIDAQASANNRVSLCLADADVYKQYATPDIKQMLDALAINKIGNVVVEPIQL